MLPRIHVVEVAYPPAIGKVQMQQGIRTKDEAQSWADKNGYAIVYWLKNRQRVYADKTSKFEKKPVMSENGQGAADFLAVIAVLAFVALFLSMCGK